MEVTRYTERLVPSTRFVTYNGKTPSAPQAFVSPASTLVGDVSISPGSSVWYGAVIRGDVNPVKIGANSSLGPNSTVHVAKIQGDYPTAIGDNVTVGAGAIVHAATVGNNVLIGAKAQVLDGAVVEDNVIIQAGTVCGPKSVMKSYTIYAGVPAKEVGKLSPDQVQSQVIGAADEVSARAGAHAAECAKEAAEVQLDEEIRIDKETRDPEYFQPNYDGEIEDSDNILGQGYSGRIFDNTLLSPDMPPQPKKNQPVPGSQEKVE